MFAAGFGEPHSVSGKLSPLYHVINLFVKPAEAEKMAIKEKAQFLFGIAPSVVRI
jgi:hypothetical protein